ncbi:hypothetical protein BaRGS_00006943 [Batillaria attramentaria]|uniref:Uncharacterized protein n=1 Tax=Batillaria attramentaria TaxID=370345 RepID=A0ABD0LQW8_9CAEN
MSSRSGALFPIRVLEDEGQCSRCDEIFPFVNIVECSEKPQMKEKCPLCLQCHQRLHPGCTDAQSQLTPSHYNCSLCSDRKGEIVCALCSLDDEFTEDILDGVLMCTACSDRVHSLHKAGHRDHFYPVPSPRCIAVMGRVGWHDLPDPFFFAPFQEHPSAAAKVRAVPSLPAVKAIPQVSTRQFHLRGHASLPIRGLTSGVRHIVIGGSRSSVTMATAPRRAPAASSGAGRPGTGRLYKLE